MAKVLVTGGAGYIGTKLIERLIRAEDEVLVIDNLMHGTSSLAPFCAYENFDFIKGDVCDPKLIKTILSDVEFIYPLAALVGAPLCDRYPEQARKVNLGAIMTLLEYVGPFHKIIYPTTNSGYGTGTGQVFCDETTPLAPISLYGQTKVEAEKYLLDHGQAVTLRLATVFGPSFRTRFDLLLNDFVQRALVEGKISLFEAHYKRNFIHLDDVVRGLLFARENFYRMRGQCYNLGLDSANISKRELAEAIGKFVPGLVIREDLSQKDPDQRNYIVSNQKIKEAGFEAIITIEEGIRQMIKVVRALPAYERNI